ncbi:hypothetical protein EDD17DRAFT_793400 [Pisolithus thermaeus]|nr:hypothetical protein EDD17DRAFT_793400 [Pisolithus thermaeus]
MLRHFWLSYRGRPVCTQCKFYSHLNEASSLLDMLAAGYMNKTREEYTRSEVRRGFHSTSSMLDPLSFRSNDQSNSTEGQYRANVACGVSYSSTEPQEGHQRRLGETASGSTASRMTHRSAHPTVLLHLLHLSTKILRCIVTRPLQRHTSRTTRLLLPRAFPVSSVCPCRAWHTFGIRVLIRALSSGSLTLRQRLQDCYIANDRSVPARSTLT